MNSPQLIKNMFSSILCKILGHKYEILRFYKNEQKEFQCIQCKKQFTENEDGDKLILTPKLRQINEVMEKFYVFRHQRQSA
ncbi:MULTISPECIES: hypothetical protein [unclassified Leeuwenhoekiella]|uniref:hypothetical protein n=1 Tax=unclassified Leeuwenhoekiella TaxID=2615029 RepID=UPI00048F6FC7|nr:hypothetical protein [Leeuwenhoekiella sp. MAR_2009_132]